MAEIVGIHYLALTQEDHDILGGRTNRSRMSERIANACSYLLRKLARAKSIQIKGLFYQEDAKVHIQFPPNDSRAFQIVHETKNGGGEH